VSEATVTGIFTGLLDRRVALAERVVGAETGALPAEEERFIAQAAARRRQEFSAGRACARAALAELGVPAAALPPGANRLPVWPSGLIGSITHTDRHAAAAVARTGEGLRAVAIDLEPAEALPDDIWDLVLRPEEAAWLAGVAAEKRAVLARAIFSAKECAFKCQYPLSGEMLEFHDLAVTLDPAAETFTATFRRDAAPFRSGDFLTGRVRIAPDAIAPAMVLGPA
jgi:4'-phosphopantetheinyl transferase EntD